ncbi:hypothetical protein [Geodermatophilus sp. SYSU D00710]
MPTVEITRPTTIRELLFDEHSDTEIAVTLAAQLPPEGLVARQLSRHRRLPKAAYRLLNSRILALAVEFLDKDVGGLVLSGLGRSRALVKAAEDTAGKPGNEVVVDLAGPYSISTEQHPYVEVLVDDQSVGRVTFALSVSVELGETSVAVEDGAMTAVDCDVAALTISFTLDGWEQPLVERKLSVPLRLSLRPPVAVPMGPSVPVERPPDPPAGSRPPVPPPKGPRPPVPPPKAVRPRSPVTGR